MIGDLYGILSYSITTFSSTRQVFEQKTLKKGTYSSLNRSQRQN